MTDEKIKSLAHNVLLLHNVENTTDSVQSRWAAH